MPASVGNGLIELLPRLRRYALVLARDGDTADELVQGACERALATENGPDVGVPLDAWMFRIIRNLWIDRGRRASVTGIEVEIDEDFEIAGGDAAHEIEQRLILADVRRAIEKLPDEQREVLMMVCVEERSYKETAEALGIPIGTVMSRLARARARLVEQTGADAGQSGRAGKAGQAARE
jgi:RNA polymerase sigma-70 factor, ECF subfamily